MTLAFNKRKIPLSKKTNGVAATWSSLPFIGGFNEHKTFWVYVLTFNLESLTMWRATLWLIMTYNEKPEGHFYL